MKKISFLAVAAMVMVGVAFASCDSKKPVSLKSELDSISYMIGSFLALQPRDQIKTFPGPELNMEAFIDGFLKVMKDTTEAMNMQILSMDLKAANDVIGNYFQSFQMEAIEASKAEEAIFLNENAKQSGVITTESGLQYKVLTEGKGPKPKLEDKVKAHYVLSLITGEVIQSSREYGEPIDFEVNGGGIKGWTEVLQLMPVGSKYQVWIPQDLAYGPPGSGHQLAGKLLIFEMELLEIVKK